MSADKDVRKAKKRSQETGPSLGAQFLSRLFLLLVLLVPAAALYGVLTAGRWAREQLRDDERYAFAFGQIDCPPPQGHERAAFLAEVQYLTEMPDRLQLLDHDLAPRLAQAFGRHPWVEKVERVAVLAPRTIQVQLTYRTPVLAVAQGERLRVVDRGGVLLPATARGDALPVFRGNVASPAGPAGQVWSDPAVEGAARLASCIAAKKETLRIKTIGMEERGFVLTTSAGSRVWWGQPPGNEAAGEALAAQKLLGLVNYCDRHGSLDQPEGPYEHDVRPAAGAIHQPIKKSP